MVEMYFMVGQEWYGQLDLIHMSVKTSKQFAGNEGPDGGGRRRALTGPINREFSTVLVT